jgi:hypothetical protein
MSYLIILISLFFLLSCGKTEDKKVSRIPKVLKTDIYKIELSPSYPSKNSVITAKVKGVNPTNLKYQWIVNDREIEGATENTLKYPGLKKGDKVQLKVFIKDQGELVSNPLIISNILPRIQSAKIIPEVPKKGDRLNIEVQTFDEDGDPVTLLYEWFINGEPFIKDTDAITIDGTMIKRGDKVSVKITPTDGEGEGNPIILYTIVANSPPNISPDIEARFDGSLYKTQIKAEDPDGDNVTFMIREGPEGMKIDPQTGLITWEVSPDDKGQHTIMVSANDGHGGEALISFIARISLTSPE